MTICMVNCCTVGLTLLAAVYEVFVLVEGEGPRRKGGVPGEPNVHVLPCHESVCICI